MVEMSVGEEDGDFLAGEELAEAEGARATIQEQVGLGEEVAGCVALFVGVVAAAAEDNQFHRCDGRLKDPVRRGIMGCVGRGRSPLCMVNTRCVGGSHDSGGVELGEGWKRGRKNVGSGFDEGVGEAEAGEFVEVWGGTDAWLVPEADDGWLIGCGSEGLGKWDECEGWSLVGEEVGGGKGAVVEGGEGVSGASGDTAVWESADEARGGGLLAGVVDFDGGGDAAELAEL